MDRNGLVTSTRGGKGHADQDPSLELMRRCRHASASVGVRIYVYGGLRGGRTKIYAEILLNNYFTIFSIFFIWALVTILSFSV